MHKIIMLFLPFLILNASNPTAAPRLSRSVGIGAGLGGVALTISIYVLIYKHKRMSASNHNNTGTTINTLNDTPVAQTTPQIPFAKPTIPESPGITPTEPSQQPKQAAPIKPNINIQFQTLQNIRACILKATQHADPHLPIKIEYTADFEDKDEYASYDIRFGSTIWNDLIPLATINDNTPITFINLQCATQQISGITSADFKKIEKIYQHLIASRTTEVKEEQTVTVQQLVQHIDREIADHFDPNALNKIKQRITNVIDPQDPCLTVQHTKMSTTENNKNHNHSITSNYSIITTSKTYTYSYTYSAHLDTYYALTNPLLYLASTENKEHSDVKYNGFFYIKYQSFVALEKIIELLKREYEIKNQNEKLTNQVLLDYLELLIKLQSKD